MLVNNPKHELDYIETYQKNGYTSNFKFVEDALIDLDTKLKYDVTSVKIDEENRFEGMSNPSDMSILYALSMQDGTKGTLLVAYGPTADADLAHFMKDVQEKQNQKKINNCCSSKNNS